jgi:hypothetical protein
MSDVGFRWVHFNFEWEEIQPTGTQGAAYDPMNYRWTSCSSRPSASCTSGNGCAIAGNCSPVLSGQSANNDNPMDVVDKARLFGFSILVTLTGPTPTWARPAGGADVPANAIDFGNFARSAAEAFAGKVYAFEIMSEPNFPEEYGGSQAEYRSRILAPAYDAIMAVSAATNQPMIVGGPGVYRGKIGPGLGGFAGWLLGTNGQLVRPIHFLSMHTYFDAVQDNINEFANAQSFADTYNIGEVWLTEFGWSSNTCNGLFPICSMESPCGNRINAIFAKLDDPAYPKLTHIFNFHGHQRTKNHCEFGCDMGIVDCDGSPRARYNEMKTFFAQTPCQ